MNVLTTLKAIAICILFGFSVAACTGFGNAHSSLSFAKNNDNTNFDKSYLTSTPWYAVATSTKQTQCLAKLVFWENDVVSSTRFQNNDGVMTKSEDIMYSLTPNTRISVANKRFYNYQSHGKQFFITQEAHFFRDYDDAIRFASERGLDCQNSFPV